MSTEYEQPGEHSWCTDYAFAVLELAKVRGVDSLSLLKALLTVEGSVVYEAFAMLGHDAKEMRTSLVARRRETAGSLLEEENWVVSKATVRAKQEGFPLSTDHLLEVIWDEETQGAVWLAERVDADSLEAALNTCRYDDPEDGLASSPVSGGLPPLSAGEALADA